MTEAEWHWCDDAAEMLEFLWQRQGVSPCAMGLRFGGDLTHPSVTQGPHADLNKALHRFYLACCRRIWKLLPQEASRRGVELAEHFLEGTASREEVSKYNWHVEGAAFCIDYNIDPEAIKRWVTEVRALPEAELRSMLHPPEAVQQLEPHELLKRAAYFVDFAMVYPSLGPVGPPPESYRPFLSADELRRHVAYPAYPLGSGQSG